MKPLINRLINLGIFFLVTFISLLFGELVIRLLFKDTMVLFPRYQTDVKYGDFTIRQNRPNMKYIHRSKDGHFDFVINNKGFRNEADIDYPKKKGETRLLCIGDSHTLGYEVKQSQVFTTVIEDLYEKKHKSNQITAINRGISGTGTAEQLVFLKNEGFKYDPDYVVLGFSDNDFRDNRISRLYKVENDSLVFDNLSYTPGTKIQNFIYRFKTVKFLGENSYLYAFAFNTVWEGIKEIRLRKSVERVKDEFTEYAIEVRTDFSYYDILLMKKLIEDMYKFCQEMGAPLIILDIPKWDMSSSIPPELVNDFRANSDTLFYANDLRKDFSNLPKVHVKYGHRHISEETHFLYANKILDYIDTNNLKKE